MGIDCVLVSENGVPIGDAVYDPTNILHRLLPSEDEAYLHLSAIDWYGNTTFNYLQMPRLMKEWQDVERRAATSDEVALVEGVRNLAEQVAARRHVYLLFFGDWVLTTRRAMPPRAD
jgi:hypothetical protein